MPVDQPDRVMAGRAEIARVVRHGLSDADVATIRAAPPHDRSAPCPPGALLIEDPEGVLRVVPVPREFQAALPRMFSSGVDLDEK